MLQRALEPVSGDAELDESVAPQLQPRATRQRHHVSVVACIDNANVIGDYALVLRRQKRGQRRFAGCTVAAKHDGAPFDDDDAGVQRQ